MDNNLPLVTIGIPTYNRAIMLKKAIESALNQDYIKIEVIVSDNASIDDTENVCRRFCNTDTRFRYIRHATNLGAKANFIEVLDKASGQFFMWLGDDDWIEPHYVSSCVEQMIVDPTVVLVSGASKYYSSGKKMYDGNIFSLLQDYWWQRVLTYYWKVKDNGIFYGVMLTDVIRSIEMPNAMGGDWHMLANIVSIGKAKMLPDIYVHRELGGVSSSFENMARICELSNLHAEFPMLSNAISAWRDIAINGIHFKSYSRITRFFVALTVFTIILFQFDIWFSRLIAIKMKFIKRPILPILRRMFSLF